MFLLSVECDALRLTDCSRACAEIWLDTHGRRFGARTRPRQVKSLRRAGQHTRAALRRGARSCYAQIAQEANASRNGACLDAGRPTILGEHRTDLVEKDRRLQDLETVSDGRGADILRAHQYDRGASTPCPTREGQAGASTPCGPTREGEARQRGTCGAWSCQLLCTSLEHREEHTALEQDKISDRSHREGQVAGRPQCRRCP